MGPRDALEPDAKNDAPHRDQQNVVWDAESVVPSFDFHVVSPHIDGLKLFSHRARRADPLAPENFKKPIT